MKWTLGLLVLLACESITRPAYFVGDASYAVVLDSTALATQFYRVGDAIAVALPGDSICVHFHADGNWQKVILWNTTWPHLEIQWVPHDVVRHISLVFAGPAFRGTSTSPQPC